MKNQNLSCISYARTGSHCQGWSSMKKVLKFPIRPRTRRKTNLRIPRGQHLQNQINILSKRVQDLETLAKLLGTFAELRNALAKWLNEAR